MMNKILKIMIVAIIFSSTTMLAKTKVAKDEVNINFKDLKIVDFVKMVARITGKNILISENIQGKVDFVSVKPIKKDQIYALLINVLNSKGFTIRDARNGFLKVIRSSDATKTAPPTYGTSEVSEVQTEVIYVKKLNVRTILRQINFLLSKYGKITLSYENNAVVVSDFPDNIKSIKNLIHKLDRGKRMQVEFVTLHNADAKSVAPKIQKLANLLFDKKIQTEKVDIFSDEATNSVIVVGNRANIRTLIPKIRVLDEENETVDKRMEIIYIKNADAVEIVKTLEKLLSDKSFAHSIKNEEREVLTSAPVPTVAKNKKGGTVPVPQTTKTVIIPSIVGKDKPTVTVDAELNAVVVYATELEIKEIKSVVGQLDVERQQVYVRARIYEFSSAKASKIGAKYGIGGGMITSSGIYGFSGSLGGDLAPVTSFSSMLSTLTAANTNLITNLSRALALGVTMSLFKNNDGASMISEPSILCVNNRESSLYSGRTQSILSQSATPTSTTGMTQNSFTREDIGLTLKIKPRISADEKVSLEVKVILEDVVGGTIGQPTTTKSEVETVSIVTNGETVIISGLAREKTISNTSKIPLLGDIPILGIPFRHVSKDKEKSNLVIMLTPYIVKRSEDLSTIKDILGKMDLLENRLAIEFDKNYQDCKTNLQRERGECVPEVIQGATIVDADYYYRIDEFGTRYKIFTDSNGHEISSEQIEDPEF
ncbi:MAG TPA: type II secretion system protein GspD [Campylobacterales bacterium]|nr:type II secretion system protein GspD [Campylobacterales bacterium]